jgi:hypothetical protein
MKMSYLLQDLKEGFCDLGHFIIGLADLLLRVIGEIPEIMKQGAEERKSKNRRKS